MPTAAPPKRRKKQPASGGEKKHTLLQGISKDMQIKLQQKNCKDDKNADCRRQEKSCDQ
jgi:hypothetical protein